MAAGDDFRAAWDEHHPQVRQYLVRRVGVDAADDLLAEVFTTAWRRWDSVPEGDARLWWLLACGRRLCANHARSLTRRASLIDRVAGRARTEATHDAVPAVVDSHDVATALAALSPADREVLILSVWEDLDAAGVAAVLGISAEAAQKRIARARARFAAAWESRSGVSDTGPHRTLTQTEDQ